MRIMTNTSYTQGRPTSIRAFQDKLTAYQQTCLGAITIVGLHITSKTGSSDECDSFYNKKRREMISQLSKELRLMVNLLSPFYKPNIEAVEEFHGQPSCLLKDHLKWNSSSSEFADSVIGQRLKLLHSSTPPLLPWV